MHILESKEIIIKRFQICTWCQSLIVPSNGFNFSKALLNFILFHPQLSHTASEKQTSNHVLKQRLSVNFKEKSVYSSDQYCVERVEETFSFLLTDINLKSFQSSLQFLWVSLLCKTSQSLCGITPATHTVTHYIPLYCVTTLAEV